MSVIYTIRQQAGENPYMHPLQSLLDKNVAWAAKIKQANPNFFLDLAKQQAPEYLWIGCSDSRVAANQIVDLPPGEVFVHRNIANLVVHTDLNCLSVIQYAVDVLKVKHIIVCGHYGCGGIKTVLDDTENGLIDNWLCHVKDVQRLHADRLSVLQGEQKEDLFCELNVIEQVKNVCSTTVVRNAWRNKTDLSVHGWVYSIKDGILKDLNVAVGSDQEFVVL